MSSQANRVRLTSVIFMRARLADALVLAKTSVTTALQDATGGRMTRVAWLLLALAACLTGSADRQRALPHDAYVWQRQWTPALAAALDQSREVVRAWRVLAAETDRQGRLKPMAVDWDRLAAAGR